MHEQSIDILNKAISEEMTASHQYMYFHFHCDDQSLGLLANLFRRIAIEEMMHIEDLAERILFLGGEVELEASDEVKKINDVKEMLAYAAHLEKTSVKEYNEFAQQCNQWGDSVSKRLFHKLVEDEEGHYDIFDTEMGHIERFGSHYLALQSIERTKIVGEHDEPPH
jgi:bacterioferritin